MSTISRDRARSIANHLTEKYSDQVNKAAEAIEEAIRLEFLKTVPKEVLAFYEKHPEFTRVTKCVYLHGNGFNCDYRSMTGYVPTNIATTANLTLNATQGAKIQKLEAKHEKLNSEYQKLKKEIESALLSLRTYKRIGEQFPEAKEFLPDTSGISTQMVVNLDDIRKKLIA